MKFWVIVYIFKSTGFMGIDFVFNIRRIQFLS